MDVTGLDEMFLNTGLPFSRDERFYTATVLPALLSEDSFAGLDTLRSLINSSASWHGTAPADCPSLPIEGGISPSNIQVLSEFDLRKALQSEESAARFSSPMKVPPVVPDLVIYVGGRQPVLLAIEAKMFLRFPRHDLESQMLLQSQVLHFLRDNLVTDDQPVIEVLQVAVLPEARLESAKYEGFPFPIVTWEGLERAFSEAQRGTYWHYVLRLVLRHWADLASVAFSKDYEKLTGRDIAQGVSAGDVAFPYQYMGRRGGLGGNGLASDLDGGAWRQTRYAVRADLPNRDIKNWFAIEEFVSLLRQRWFQGSTVLAHIEALAASRGWSMVQGAEKWMTLIVDQLQGLHDVPPGSNISPDVREKVVGEMIALTLALGLSLGMDPLAALERVLAKD